MTTILVKPTGFFQCDGRYKCGGTCFEEGKMNGIYRCEYCPSYNSGFEVIDQREINDKVKDETKDGEDIILSDNKEEEWEW